MMRFVYKFRFVCFSLFIVFILGACSNDDSNKNPNVEKLLALQDKNRELLEDKNVLQEKISKLQSQIGDLREKNGLAKGLFLESYGVWIILFVSSLIIGVFFVYRKEKRECDEKLNKVEEEKVQMKDYIDKQKDEIRSIYSEIEQLRKDSEHGERNEVVSLIKRVRESRKHRVNLLNEGGND